MKTVYSHDRHKQDHVATHQVSIFTTRWHTMVWRYRVTDLEFAELACRYPRIPDSVRSVILRYNSANSLPNNLVTVKRMKL